MPGYFSCDVWERVGVACMSRVVNFSMVGGGVVGRGVVGMRMVSTRVTWVVVGTLIGLFVRLMWRDRAGREVIKVVNLNIRPIVSSMGIELVGGMRSGDGGMIGGYVRCDMGVLLNSLCGCTSYHRRNLSMS